MKNPQRRTPTMKTKHYQKIKNVYTFLATTQINLRPSRKVSCCVGWIAMTIGLLVAGTSCASVDGNRARIEVRAALANIERATAAFNAMTTGDVENMDTNNGFKIGGGGDTVTEWGLIAVIALMAFGGTSVAGGKFYELVLRRLRKAKEREAELMLERQAEAQQRVANRIQVTELKTAAMNPNSN